MTPVPEVENLFNYRCSSGLAGENQRTGFVPAAAAFQTNTGTEEMLLTDTQAPQTASQYTEEQWEEDSYMLFGERAEPRPCPKCGHTGFYGPRAADPALKFHCCRFCGFYQEVGGEQAQFLPVVHGCDAWPVCAKAPYVWWLPPDAERFLCPFCGHSAVVRSLNVFKAGIMVDRPSDLADHPWRKVPQSRDYAYYLRFWENWDFTKGRVVL